MDYEKEKLKLQELMSEGKIEPKEFENKMADCDKKIKESENILNQLVMQAMFEDDD